MAKTAKGLGIQQRYIYNSEFETYPLHGEVL
jgi:hypothetical protein